MIHILLTLKVLGIVISGASIIGSERLKNLENKFRAFVGVESINENANNAKARFLLPLLSWFLKFNEVLFSAKEKVSKLNVQPPSQKKKEKNRELTPVEKIRKFIAPIRLLVAPVVLVLVLAGIFLAFALSIMAGIAIFFFFAIILVAALIVMGLSEILKVAIWIVSRPYAWLDFEVRKRDLESTIVVIGITIAVVAEVISVYTQ